MISVDDSLTSCRHSTFQIMLVVAALLGCAAHSYFLHAALADLDATLKRCGCV